MPVGIDGNGIITGVSDFSSSNVSLTDPEITGGIYLGGTGSANYLDDYEEGTWTPTPDDGTLNVLEARYEKIGSLVFASARVNTFSDTASGNALLIKSLPFAPKKDFDAYSGIASGSYTSSGIAFCNVSFDSVQFFSSDFARLDNANISSTTLIQFTAIYKTS